MVDLRATNHKLRDRGGERILMEVCGIERDQAKALLAEARGRVKVAIVMHKLRLGCEQAEQALEKERGAIRRITREEPPPI